METPIAPDSGDEEHAVIAHFRHASDGFGDADQRERIYEAEQVMEAATEEAGVGEIDGNEFGGGKAVVYAYGPDADALFKSWSRLCAVCRSGRHTSFSGRATRRPVWICRPAEQRRRRRTHHKRTR